jgi:DNA-binding NtrC family response regulator
MNPIQLLVVDDEAMIRRTLLRKFQKEGYTVVDVATGEEARAQFEQDTWDAVLLDINLPGVNGLELLKEFRAISKDTPVIMMTGNADINYVVQAMKDGAYDYITKPFNLEEVVLAVRKALEVTALRREVRNIRSNLEHEYGFDKVIGKSESMSAVLEMAKTVAESEAETVLILGESGTGKNLIAQAIHYNSRRAASPFMEVTCTALPEPLLESELFGHERGAFTDARTTKKGLCELAHKGTLFMDEIGDMPLPTQAKLLGFLESRSVRRVGGTRPLQVDVRVIAATNASIESLVAEKYFREDLYYRLNVIEITIPPLRERKDDIPLLARFFLNHFNQKFNKKVRDIEPAAVENMLAYDWPGNIRELRNAIERAMILTKGETIGVQDLPLKAKTLRQTPQAEGEFLLPENGISLEEVERTLVFQALERTNNNQTKAARLLHISRDQLRYRMKAYGLLS